MNRRQLHEDNQSGGNQRKFQPSLSEALPDPLADSLPDKKTQIWQVVALIPAGKVATYGQIAGLIGLPGHARYVGATLKNLPKNTKLPWFRVVNAGLRISLRGGGEQRQRQLLETEGITFIGQRIAEAHRWEAGNE